MFDGSVITPYVQRDQAALSTTKRPQVLHQREQQLLQLRAARRRPPLSLSRGSVALPLAALRLLRGARVAISG